MLQDVIVDRDTGSDHFRYPALDYGFGGFRIFKLFTDCHPLSGPYQSWQISIQSMVGKSCQFNEGGRAIGPPGESNAQYAGGFYRILAECFIEIPNPEKQNSIRIFALDRIILLHQGRLNVLIFAL
jgi:hypothetical protein